MTTTTTTPTRRRRPRQKPTWELVYKRNSVEALKREKFPLDIVDDLPRLIEMGYEAVPEEDIVRLNWWGLTHDKPKTGTFMVRIKVPGGRVTPEQLRGVGRISQEYGRDYGELTTRQGLQLHWVRLDQLPEVIDAVRDTGLTTVGGEGDTVRNVTSCPVAGLSADELFDVGPEIDAIVDYFYGNRDYSDLPRKHKFTVSACPGQCNAPEIHDIALVAAIKDGREGYAVRVGGGLSNTPRIARDLGVFVPRERSVEVLKALTDAWQSDPAYRISRAKARIKFMVDDHGPEGMRKLLEERLGERLEDLDAPEPEPGHDHLGVHPQRDPDLSWVGVPVPMGWISGEQMLELADLVEGVGGDLRLTRQQNFIVGNVPVDHLGGLLSGLHRIGFPADRNLAYGGSIACTSHKFCNYSVAETKGKLQEVLEVLDERHGDRVSDLKVFMDGCPHSCAHHWVGDIGLQGTTTKLPGHDERVEAYDVTLRGGLGAEAAIGTPLLRRVPTDDLVGVLDRLVTAWLDERDLRNGDGAALTFHAFCTERSDEELRALADGEQTVGADGDDVDDGRPVVRVPGTLLELSDGADEIPVEAATVGEALGVLRTEAPDLAAYLLDGDGGISREVNLYVDEEDVRTLGGLDAPLEAGDELTILPALAGGC